MSALRIVSTLLLAAPLAWGQANLDDTVQRTLKEFNVPGIAVGVIKDGKVITAKGFGIRKLGDPAPVTSKTLFGIASNTKAFTSAALAILVDEKKLEWDQRVVDVLPSFQLSDPYVSREMRISDLLVHRSGLALGAGDLMVFPDGNLTAKEIIQRLRYVPLSTSFRSKYAYDNVLYAVAGAVIEQVSGKTWGQFIKERIFQPLGMKRSLVRLSDLPAGEDIASPHAPDEGKLRVVTPSTMEADAPAGAIQSSVDEMLLWVDLQLREGAYGKERLFSERQSREMWTPYVWVPINPKPKKELAELKPNFSAYALGWTTRDYRGQRIISHTGGLSGMVTQVTLVPEKQLGIVVLTNQEVGAAFSTVTTSILDHYLGAPPKDWVAAFGAVYKRQMQAAKEEVSKAADKRDAASKPSLPLAKYADRYRDPWYGDVMVEEKDGRLTMRFTHSEALSGPLEHFQYDTFIARWKDRSLDADAYVTFSLNADGSISGIKMKAISPSTDFSYDFHDLVLTPAPKDAPAY